ncbi:MAG: endopeptidase La [Bdellovibrionota bacterium]
MSIFPEREIPVLLTGELVIFPGAEISLYVKQPRNVEAVQLAQKEDGWILAVSVKGSERSSQDATREDLSKVGVVGKLVDVQQGRGSGLQITFRAQDRFQIGAVIERDGVFLADGAALIDRNDADEGTLASLHATLQSTAIEILELLPADTTRLIEEVRRIGDPAELSHRVSQSMSLGQKDAQEILETTSLKNRLLKLLELLVNRKESLKVQFKIQETLSESVGKKQREAVLREQLKAIQEELGEGGEGPSPDDYRKRVEDAGMTDEAKQVALREVSRLERMSDQSAESHVIRSYLDLLCEMPWNKTSQDEIDLERAEAVLERDHYGLKKIKRRILEHLAVMKLRSEKRGSILLFVGPPGVGKTSLGKSIAEALGRQFVRASLGGVRDDADIRGHRRTYVGALPGRIVDGIRRAKTKDPVFVLDEIDKMSHGWGGDPASALLEVLDPEQNGTFHDHYLDVAFDLSEVLFIATANTRDSIPGPLLDRMEVIELTGYTTDEKLHIAKNHLLPDELGEHGLKEGQLELGDDALIRVIEGYTREAGVRSLRRELAKVCRHAAIRVAKNPLEKVTVDSTGLDEILGFPKFELEELESERVPGVVTGMAWTPVGGDVLFVEAVNVPGDGKVAVTGQLGDVMRESSQIAVALARVKLEGIAQSVLYKDRDIHIHVPAGAIPKDGPSAGVTLFTAVASMMLDVPVNPKLAMTGELTLRGKVLPVGGIKEKVLAAARFGVEEIILPSRNRKDLDELPADVRGRLKVHLVSDVNELLGIVFGTIIPDGIPNGGLRPSVREDAMGRTEPTAGEQLHRGSDTPVADSAPNPGPARGAGCDVRGGCPRLA